MKALLKNYHQAPRKVRLIADLIRGKSVTAAQAALLYHDKKAAPAMKKLLDSAVANARQTGVSEKDLYVKTISVDKGIVMRRYRPFARGRAGRLAKITSIVKIELGSHGALVKAAKADATEAPKKVAAKKPAAKKVATKATKPAATPKR
ncbi:50S ribosomal protein L22 [Candidatus Kaiserbacteria bacterium]|nr:50S ribosomal protein L22 [Candidatus Kaiserbacteria bacterium]